VVQECGVGLVRIRREPDRLAFAAPALQRSAPGTGLLERVVQALGIRADRVIATQSLDNGTAWLGLLLDAPNTVLQLTPDFAGLKDTAQKVGVVARYTQAPCGAPDMEVRAFAPHLGVNEDPVTGSLNASLAQWLMADGYAPDVYMAAQGGCLQRAGRVSLQRDGTGQVWVGGQSVTCILGQVTI